MAASVPEQLGEDRPNRQLTNPQDDARGDIADESFTGRWADSYPREKTSEPITPELLEEHRADSEQNQKDAESSKKS